MSQGEFNRSVIEKKLGSDEKIVWTGKPDLQAIKKTAYRGRPRPWQLGLCAVVLLAWLATTFWNQTGDGSAGDLRLLIVGGSAILCFFMMFKVNDRVVRWAQPLGYAITDKRVLIFRNGEIENDYSQGDVRQASVIPRRKVEGFSDIIWEQRAVTTGSSNRYPSPLAQEKARTGFRALADGEAVMQKLDAWVTQQADITQRQDDEFIDRKSSDAVAEEDKAPGSAASISNTAKYISPRYGFSIEFPDTWEIVSRYRKLAFGKWGIEREPKWSVPDAKPKWNVIRGKNQSKTHVEVQVQKVAPFNTLQSIKNTSAAASMLGTGEVIDHEASATINGIPGFYVTRKLAAEASILPSQIQEKLSSWNMRQYILHDGQYQYYIEAMWLVDSPGQLEVCEAVVATLTSCRVS